MFKKIFLLLLIFLFTFSPFPISAKPIGTPNPFTVANHPSCSAELEEGDTVSNIDLDKKETYTLEGLCAPTNINLKEPYLISPKDEGFSLPSNVVTFKVTPSEGAATYDINVRDTSDNNILLPVCQNLTTTSCTVTLKKGHSYAWNANAHDAQGRSGWFTDRWYFDIANDEPNALPTISVTPQSQTVEEGSNGHFTLSSTNTRSISAGGASCDISGAGLQNYILSDGNYNIGPMKYSHGVNGVVTFDFKCYGANNQIASQSITINVNKKEVPPPPQGTPTATISQIPDTKTSQEFPITINTTNIPNGTNLELSSSPMGQVFPKSITINNNTYTGNIKVTSAINDVKINVKYNDTSRGTLNTLATSNTFKISPVCSSSLSELELNEFELSGLCVPRNLNLPNPEPQYPGSYDKQNYQEVSSTTQTFSWSTVPNAATYSLYVRNEDTGILEVDKEGLTGTSYEVTNLKPNNSYRWNVRAKGADGKGGWLSELFYFRVNPNATDTDNDNTAIEFHFVDEFGNAVEDIEILKIDCYPVSTDECQKQINLQGVPEVVKGTVKILKNVYKFPGGVLLKIKDKFFGTEKDIMGDFMAGKINLIPVKFTFDNYCPAIIESINEENDPENYVRVLSNDKWRTQIPDMRACFRTNSEVLGYTPLSNHRIITVFYDNDINKNLIVAPDISKGVDKIYEYLLDNEPIMVGVHRKPGYSETENPNNATHHFVVISGYGTDEKGKYLTFFDPGTSNKSNGVNLSNRLYFNEDTKIFSGKSQYYSNTYTVTEVRPK